MKLISKAMMGGLAVAATAIVACSASTTSPSGGGTGSTQPASTSGEIGLHLTLADGSTLNSLSYQLLTGTTVDSSGTITLPTGTFTTPYSVPTDEIAPVAPGTGYTIKVTGTAAPDGVTCTGTSAAFNVVASIETQVTVIVTCTSTTVSGSIELNPIVQFCPTLQTLTGLSSTPQYTTTQIGGTVGITAAASGPNQAGVTYTWTDNSPLVGGLSTQVNAAGGLSSEVTFTCAASGTGSVTVATTDQAVPTLYCSDQSSAGNATCALAASAAGTACGTGGTCVQVNCPASQTTQTVTFVCGNPAPCTGVGTGVETTGDTATGACPAAQYNSGTLKDGQGNYCCSADSTPCNVNGVVTGSGTETSNGLATGTCPSGQVVVGQDQGGFYCCGSLAPCTATNTENCVACQGSAGGTCTTTESYFVQRDISLGLVTAAGNDNVAGSCYQCLINHSCLDSTTLGVTTKECSDSNPLVGGTAAQCNAVISCVATSGATDATECAYAANGGVNTCYCGTDSAANCSNGTATAPITTGVNGACASQMATALGFPLGDGSDIESNITNTGLAGGRADQIFVCATSGNCANCL